MSLDRWRRGGAGTQVGMSVAIVLFVLWTLLPIIWMVATAFLKQRALIQRPPDLSPGNFTFDNLLAVIRHSDALWRGMGNSLLAAFFSTAVSLALGAPAAYALARLRLPGASAFSFMILATQMLPGIAIAIPLFLVISSLGLIDHVLTLSVVYLSFNLPIVIWILRGFFLSIPLSLEKAATIDGASIVQTFWHVFLPISWPPLAAAAIFAFIESWNEFFFALILTRQSAQTLPLVIASFEGQYQVAFGKMMSAACLSVAPVILLSILFRNYIIRGFADGMSKG